jgi:hypothetical protein
MEEILMTIGEVLERVAAKGAMTAPDALAVRRAVYGADLAVTPGETEQMLEVDEAARSAGARR